MVKYTYNARGSRFVSMDDVAYIDPETIGGLNLFAYCGNDPVMYADKSGHSWETFWQVGNICNRISFRSFIFFDWFF